MKISPKKFLGQNFLINKGIVEKIISASDLSKNDMVLEVGPGMGALTQELIKYAGRVIAVEKDKRFFELLKEKFKDADNIELINADIIKFYQLPTTNYKLVANIPYNITGQFFQKFLLTENRPSLIVVMVQKEVGERLLGKKDRSLLTLATELYGRAEKICDVSPGSFNPPPKVTSMVVKMTATPSSFLPLTKGEEGWGMEQKIMRLAKIGFSSRRKKLLSNLSTGLKKDKKYLADIFLRLGLNTNARAEELSKSDWLKLAENIKN